MTTVIDGKKVAASVIETVKAATKALETDAGVRAGLAVVIVGDDPASHAYVSSKSKMAKECGFLSIQHTLPEATTQEELAALVAELNADAAIHGILVQLPLPKHLNSEPIIQSILPEKDVDGLHIVNAGKLATGDLEGGLVSCTPAGAMVFVRQTHGDDLSGLNAVVIGRSNLFGKPMSALLLAANATVTTAHSRTKDLAAVCRGADILVAAVGRPRMPIDELRDRIDSVLVGLSAQGANLAVRTGAETVQQGLDLLTTRGIVVVEDGRLRVRDRFTLRYYARTIEHLLQPREATH